MAKSQSFKNIFWLNFQAVFFTFCNYNLQTHNLQNDDDFPLHYLGFPLLFLRQTYSALRLHYNINTHTNTLPCKKNKHLKKWIVKIMHFILVWCIFLTGLRKLPLKVIFPSFQKSNCFTFKQKHGYQPGMYISIIYGAFVKNRYTLA